MDGVRWEGPICATRSGKPGARRGEQKIDRRYNGVARSHVICGGHLSPGGEVLPMGICGTR
jgi:hypothetical protein